MQLPGGLVEGGARRRGWAFRPVSGEFELALAEVAEQRASTPRAVTRALALALDHLGGEAATEARTAALCVADRQFLMRELDRHLGFDGGWFHADCGGCGARFDFRINYADLPVTEAGEGFPLAEVEVGGRRLRFRLPTGADQEALVGLPESQAPRWLLGRIAESAEQPAGIESLGADAIAAVEAALEAVSPGVVVQVGARCPECGAANAVDLDPYRALARRSDGLLDEVHRIAIHYHWSEAEILALPYGRRQRYLRLIDRARGMSE